MYVKQPHGSSLPPSDVQENLKKLADEIFSDAHVLSAPTADKTSIKNQVTVINQACTFSSFIRRYSFTVSFFTNLYFSLVQWSKDRFFGTPILLAHTIISK